MAAVDVEIATGITTELNTSTEDRFGVAFTAERSYADFKIPLTELGTLKVDVVPWAITVDPVFARGSVKYDVETDILIRKRFGQANQQSADSRIPTSDFDALCLVRQNIAEFFMPCQPNNTGRALSSVPDAAWQDTKIISSVYRPHANTRQFTAWIRLTYEITRAL